MRPPRGSTPRFGPQGSHFLSSPNQNKARPHFSRPPFPTGPRHLRGNHNQHRHGRPSGPYGPMMGPNGPMVPPMMGLNGMMMSPSGPLIGPNGFMGTTGFMNAPGFTMPIGPAGTSPSMPLRPSIQHNVGAPKNCNGPQAAMSEQGAVQSDSKEKSKGNCQNSVCDGDNNYSHFGCGPTMNFGWQGNGFPMPQPNGWNYGIPTNQFYYQNPNQNMDHQCNINQRCNQDYSQSFAQGYNMNYDESYNQYFNQGHPQNGYLNIKQEPVDMEQNQDMGYQRGPKNKRKRNISQTAPQTMRMHYCDTCDRSLPTEEALSSHIAEHKVCDLDGCKFTAHPRVVEKHQQMQHFTGLYRRIGSLYTPEDIEKWRNERKKNYPSVENVEERRAKQEEMFARGERMGGPRAKRFPRQQRNGRPPPRQGPQVNLYNKENPSCSPQTLPEGQDETPKKWKPIFPPIVAIIEESEERSGVKPFPGTAALLPKEDDLTENDVTSKVGEKPSLFNSLSFLDQYGGSSSEEEDNTEESPKESVGGNVSRSLESSNERGILDADGNADDTSMKPKSDDSGVIQESTVMQEAATYRNNDSLGSENTRPVSPMSEKSVVCESKKTDETTEKTESILESFDEKIVPLSPQPLSEELSKNISDFSMERARNKDTESNDSITKDSDKLTTSHPSTETSSDVQILEQSNKKINHSNGAHDSSDDSGPEEMPIDRDDGATEGNNNKNEDGDEKVQGGCGRKRKRPSRAQAKKLKTDGDEKQANPGQPQKQANHNTQTRQDSRNRAPVIQRTPRKRVPTLLEKLLSKEICHERNVILQCVRYAVENNFFRNDRPPSSENDISKSS